MKVNQGRPEGGGVLGLTGGAGITHWMKRAWGEDIGDDDLVLALT